MLTLEELECLCTSIEEEPEANILVVLSPLYIALKICKAFLR